MEPLPSRPRSAPRRFVLMWQESCLPRQTRRDFGDSTFCPVSGRVLGIERQAIKLYIGDYPLYLAGEDCIAAVKQSPEKYLPHRDSWPVSVVPTTTDNRSSDLVHGGSPMPDRTIFVISDLHMGDGGPRDNFPLGDREKQLNLFLDYVGRQQGELIILGDLFDFWQMNLSKIVMLHMPLLDRLAAMNATYVVGNHDADFDHFIGTGFLSHPLLQRMCGPFEREIGGKRFKFMHGHEVDPLNSGDMPGTGKNLLHRCRDA